MFVECLPDTSEIAQYKEAIKTQNYDIMSSHRAYLSLIQFPTSLAQPTTTTSHTYGTQ